MAMKSVVKSRWLGKDDATFLSGVSFPQGLKPAIVCGTYRHD